MLRFIKELSLKRYTGDLPSERSDLDKYKEFIKFNHDKIKTYSNAASDIIENIEEQMKTIDFRSTKAKDKFKKNQLKKICNETLFWFTKSKELLSTILNYNRYSIYEEDNLVDFVNATQKLYLQGFENIKDEYLAFSKITGVKITVANLGHDTERSVKIVNRIVNDDLGINYKAEVYQDFECERMKSVDLDISDIDCPTQQCRAYYIVEIYDKNDNILLKTNVKEIFFRKEGN